MRHRRVNHEAPTGREGPARLRRSHRNTSSCSNLRPLSRLDHRARRIALQPAPALRRAREEENSVYVLSRVPLVLSLASQILGGERNDGRVDELSLLFERALRKNGEVLLRFLPTQTLLDETLDPRHVAILQREQPWATHRRPWRAHPRIAAAFRLNLERLPRSRAELSTAS